MLVEAAGAVGPVRILPVQMLHVPLAAFRPSLACCAGQVQTLQALLAVNACLLVLAKTLRGLPVHFAKPSFPVRNQQTCAGRAPYNN